jgi:uncharacterized protein with HEPN domain
MSKRAPQLYLEDVVDAIKRIEDFVGDMPFEQFEKDDKTIFAVVRALEIMGRPQNGCP